MKPLVAAGQRVGQDFDAGVRLHESISPGTIADDLDLIESESETANADQFVDNEPIELETASLMAPVLGHAIRTKWLDTRAAAALLGKTVGTLRTYRWMGTGPEVMKIERRIVYSLNALIA